MDLYDEDLSENKFFRSLADKFPNLFDVATCNRCTICVPCISSLLSYSFTKENIDSHVLVAVEEKPSCFVTVNGKELTIQNDIVTRGNGFTHTDPIPVLFEETFFNANDESYMVLCIAQPLDGAATVHESQTNNSVLSSFIDYTNFLWGETGGEKNKKLVDQAISSFLGHLHFLERESLTKHIDATSDLFTKAMQIVLKNQHLKKPAFQDNVLMENVKVAVEAYVLHCVYKPLFAGICSCLAAHDEQLNMITRNLHELQLRDVGVRLEFCRNIPRARKELGYLMSYSTPLGKLNCLKRAVRTLMQPVQRANQAGNPLMVTTDDLLPMLIFLVVKMDMPNWWANLTYMTNFHFAKSSNHDEYGFYLACLEAALEHVGAGQMEALMDGVETSQGIQLSVSPGSGTLWKKQDSDKSAVDCFFEHVRENKVREAARMLNSSAAGTAAKSESSDSTYLCHPLCTCAKCRPIVGAQEKDIERSQVTVNSRDERGFTGLHLACACGHMAMTEMLLERGSSVTATDYHGSTPLHMACLKGHQRLALLLLHYDASVLTSRDNDGNTPLHLATATGHKYCVKAILYESKISQSNIDDKNDFGETPLHIAAKWGFLSIAELLLEHGATAETYNRRNLTPLHYAQSNKMTRLLTDFASQQLVHRQRRHTRSDSSTSVNCIHPVVPPVKALPGSKTCPNLNTSARPKSNSGPRTEKSAEERKVDKLLKSVADGDVEMMKFHLGWTSESDDDDIDLTQRKLCHPLCQCDKCQPLQKYYTPSPSGMHVNVCNSAGYSPLHMAAQCGRDVLVELLIRRGGDASAKTALHSHTPLHLACKYGMTEAAKLLLKYGAPVDAKDARGKTPFDLSVNSSHGEMSDIFGPKIPGSTNKPENTVAASNVSVPADDGASMDHFSAVPTSAKPEVDGGETTKETAQKIPDVVKIERSDHAITHREVMDMAFSEHDVSIVETQDTDDHEYEAAMHQDKVGEDTHTEIHEAPIHEFHDSELPDRRVPENHDHDVDGHQLQENEIGDHEVPRCGIHCDKVPEHEAHNDEVPDNEVHDDKIYDNKLHDSEVGDQDVTSKDTRCDSINTSSLEDASETTNDKERSHEDTHTDYGITRDDDTPLCTDCSDEVSPDTIDACGGRVDVRQEHAAFSIMLSEKSTQKFAENSICCHEVNADGMSERFNEDTTLYSRKDGNEKCIADDSNDNMHHGDTGSGQPRTADDIPCCRRGGDEIVDAHATEKNNCIPHQDKGNTQGVASDAVESRRNEKQHQQDASSTTPSENAPEIELSHAIDQDAVGRAPRSSSIINKCAETDAADDNTDAVSVDDCIAGNFTADILPIPLSITSSNERAQDQTSEAAGCATYAAETQ